MSAAGQSALIAAAGLGMAAWTGRTQKKRGYPLPVVPMTRSQVQDQQILALRRMIQLNKQQTSNFSYGYNYTIPAGNLQYVDYNLTANFCNNAEYPKLVLGDQFINKYLRLRYSCAIPSTTGITRYRVVVYWSRDPGTSWVPSGFESIPDPASFVVIGDKMAYPSSTGHISGQQIIFNLPLKNRKTIYNYSVPAIKSGELHAVVLADNTSAASINIAMNGRLLLANK